MSAVTTGCPADLAAAHTLLGCLAREVTGPTRTDGYAELRLTGTGVRLRCAATRFSPVGAHRWAGPVLRWDGTGWSPVDAVGLARLVAAELTVRTGVANDEFVGQVTASRDAVRRVLDARPAVDPYATGDPVTDAYVDSEQSLVHGHPAHPTPKWRTGDPRAWDRYAPELRAAFRLRWFGVPRSLAAGDGAFTDLLAPLEPPVAPAGHVALPVHPWQAELAGPPPAGVLDLGTGGVAVRPTASVRTLYAPYADLFVKTSLSVRITNCLRTNARYELTGAVVLTRLLAGLPLEPGVALLGEPAYRTVDLPGADAAYGVILRDGLRRHLGDGQTAVLAAALSAGPMPVPDPVGWWRAYTGLLVPGVLGLWAGHGVVHEAHPQNVVVVLGADGRPVRMLLRDLEGVKLDTTRRGDWLAGLPHQVGQEPRRAFDRLAYCLFVNHLGALAGALADAHPGVEPRLWAVLRDVVAGVCDRYGGPPPLRDLLAGAPMPAKGNLLLRWRRAADSAAGYLPVPNPWRPR